MYSLAPLLNEDIGMRGTDNRQPELHAPAIWDAYSMRSTIKPDHS